MKPKKEIAKCYYQQGWWKYYRTDDGNTYSVRDGRHYFYNGNIKTEKWEEKYLSVKEVERLKKHIEFVDEIQI